MKVWLCQNDIKLNSILPSKIIMRLHVNYVIIILRQ